MNEQLDRAMMKMFLKTGDPFYYTARGILRERAGYGGSDPGQGDRTGQDGL